MTRKPSHRDLTDREVAERTRASLRTVQRWCSNGRLPGAYKVGRAWRIPTTALDTLVERRGVRAVRRARERGLTDRNLAGTLHHMCALLGKMTKQLSTDATPLMGQLSREELALALDEVAQAAEQAAAAARGLGAITISSPHLIIGIPHFGRA